MYVTHPGHGQDTHTYINTCTYPAVFSCSRRRIKSRLLFTPVKEVVKF